MMKLKPVLILSILFSLYLTSNSQSCTTYTFASNKVFSSCNDLPNLHSYIHWNYNQAAKTLSIAYRHTNVTDNSWVAWAINPTGTGMLGAQSLVALQQSDGTMRAYTSPVKSYRTSLMEGGLSFPVSDLTATYEKNEIIIFATLGIDNGSSVLNQVWQDGPVSGNTPGVHSLNGDNMQSMGTIDFFSGQTHTVSGGASSPKGAPSPNTKKTDKMAKKASDRKTHGLLNAVGWGILLPIGALSARYLKVFPSVDPAWFYIHVICQTSGYIVASAGLATGLRLGSQRKGDSPYQAHRIIGIVVFALTTMQVLSLFVRPKKEHKLRFYWNVYHHSLGYAIIVLSIVNIFIGFNIWHNFDKASDIWKRAYVGILIGLAVVVAVLEAYTWFVVLKREKSGNEGDGTNAHKRYGEKTRDIV